MIDPVDEPNMPQKARVGTKPSAKEIEYYTNLRKPLSPKEKP
jgi:hypothetical protein